MGHVEDLKRAHEMPGNLRRFNDRTSRVTGMMRAYYAYLVTIDELRLVSSVLRTERPVVKLENPDILMDVLTSFGFTEDDMRSVVDEEKAHFIAAQSLGLIPMVHIWILANLEEDGRPASPERRVAVAVHYNVPNLAPDDMKALVSAISLAPENPSKYDLALADRIPTPQS